MSQPKTFKRKVQEWLVGLTLAKSLVFLGLVLFLHVKPFVGDNTTNYFIPIAERINAIGSFNDTSTTDYSSVPPGYPFILAVLYRTVGSFALPTVIGMQFLADLSIAFFLLEMGMRFGNSRAGAAAAAVWLVFPPAVVISAWVTPETLFTAMFIGALLLISVPDPKRIGLKWMALSGLLLGLATLLRGNTLLLPIVYVAYWFWRRAFSAAIVFTLVFAIPVAMWTIRNRVVLGDPIMVSTTFGAAFMQGSDDKFYQGKATEYPIMFREAEAAGIRKPTIETGSNASHWMFQIGIHNYRMRLEKQGIFAVAGHLARKLGYMWFLVESGNKKEEALLFVCSLAVAPLGLWELWLWLWYGDEARRIGAITVAFWIALHLLVVPVARYTIPILPVIVLAACFRGAALLGWRDSMAPVR